MAKKKKTKDIPPSKLKWLKRPKERKELPAHHFLLPKERKFPYKNKDGTINCRLLRAAITRAAQHGYPSVEKRARKLYEKHCKAEKALFDELLDLTYPDMIKAVEEKPNEIWVRVKSPARYDPKSFRRITLSKEKGIHAVVACPKGQFKGGKCQVGTEIQAYRFEKDKWTKSEAKKWVKEHKKSELELDLQKAYTSISPVVASIHERLEEYVEKGKFSPCQDLKNLELCRFITETYKLLVGKIEDPLRRSTAGVNFVNTLLKGWNYQLSKSQLLLALQDAVRQNEILDDDKIVRILKKAVLKASAGSEADYEVLERVTP